MGASKKLRRASEYSQKGFENMKNSVDAGMLLRDSMRPQQNEEPAKIRIQQTADERHSENAEKKRKVDLKEIEHLGDHLRFRFLGLRLSLEEVRKYLDRKNDATNPENAHFLL